MPSSYPFAHRPISKFYKHPNLAQQRQSVGSPAESPVNRKQNTTTGLNPANMPSITSISHFTLTNLGPLTTTWTAPQSCATKTNIVYLAQTLAPANAWYSPDCLIHPPGDCYPGGASQIDDIYKAFESVIVAGPIPYYSPGLHCPDTWTTAGIAVKDGNGTLVSSSGLFAPTAIHGISIKPGPSITYTDTYVPPQQTVTTTRTVNSSLTQVITTTHSPSIELETITTTFAPSSNPAWNIFMEAMAPSETAVVCCPRYELTPSLLDQC